MTKRRVVTRPPLEMLIRDIVVGKQFRRDMGDIAGLAASIRDIGLLQPVVVRSDRKLVAGERRVRAYQLLQRDRIPVHVIDIAKIVRGEYAENTERENFTLSEAVAIKRAVEPQIKAEAQQRKVLGGKLKGKAGANLAPAPKGKARDLVAKRTGRSRTTLAKADVVLAAWEAEPDNPTLRRMVEAMDRSGRADGPYKRLVNMRQAAAIRAEPPPLPGRGPYRGGLVDIPWAYEPDDENAPQRGVLPYPTMSIEQACAMDVATRLHDDAVVGMWVTNYVLARGLHLPVLKAWGLDPKTVITWPKDRAGQGHWAKGQTEHLLIAIRGKPTVTLVHESTLLKPPFHLVQKSKHSAKPIEAYEYFESLYPAPRYFDLFSRYRHNNKWDPHGDEAPAEPSTLLDTSELEAAE